MEPFLTTNPPSSGQTRPYSNANQTNSSGIPCEVQDLASSSLSRAKKTFPNAPEIPQEMGNIWNSYLTDLARTIQPPINNIQELQARIALDNNNYQYLLAAISTLDIDIVFQVISYYDASPNMNWPALLNSCKDDDLTSPILRSAATFSSYADGIPERIIELYTTHSNRINWLRLLNTHPNRPEIETIRQKILQKPHKAAELNELLIFQNDASVLGLAIYSKLKSISHIINLYKKYGQNLDLNWPGILNPAVCLSGWHLKDFSPDNQPILEAYFSFFANTDVYYLTTSVCTIRQIIDNITQAWEVPPYSLIIDALVAAIANPENSFTLSYIQQLLTVIEDPSNDLCYFFRDENIRTLKESIRRLKALNKKPGPLQRIRKLLR